MRQIEVSVDTFAQIWAARVPGELNEDQILSRILSTGPAAAKAVVPEAVQGAARRGLDDLPPSVRWTDLLIWTLRRHGGRAPLSEIYRTSRQGRLALGYKTTEHHDAAARERLEAHCRACNGFKGKELFYMPEGKGAGVWALVGQ